MMSVERIALSTVLPLSSETLAEHVRVGDAEQIAEAERLAFVAASEVEQLAGLALLTQTIRLMLDGWPGGWLHLPIAPLPSDGTVAVTVGGEPVSPRAVVPGRRPALLLDALRPEGVVLIEYEAGYGTTAESVPADLRHAVADQAAALFDARGVSDAKTISLSPHLSRIVARYKRLAV
ncbi:head-tail connector protein [Paroceanicella profunda]|nr:hypothetical protein [Paroceanicella profunda]